MKIETVKYTNYYYIALDKIFKELFCIETKKIGSYILKDDKNLKDITSIMKLTGDLYGITLISFTDVVLSHLYIKLIGVEHENKNRIEDTSNEILNMIIGQAKNLIAINYNKLIKLHPPILLNGGIDKPVLINEVMINNSQTFIFGAYLTEK
jgi:CheY-specific phosphatase CheX